MRRPEANEYAEYYGLYVNQVPDGDVMEILRGGVELTASALEDIPATWENHRYQAEKWSIREVLGHVVDVERLFSFRALCFARADPTPLPGMDQDVWAAQSNAEDRPVADLLKDLGHARASSLAFLESLPSEAWSRRGVASSCEFTVRSCSYILAGHEIHHRRVLEEKYLGPLRAAGD